MSRPFIWSTGRVAELRRLWDTDLTAFEIAERIGAPSKSAVLGKARREGLPTRQAPSPWTEEMTETVARLHYQHKGACYIARRLGVSEDSVRHKIERMVRDGLVRKHDEIQRRGLPAAKGVDWVMPEREAFERHEEACWRAGGFPWGAKVGDKTVLVWPARRAA